MQAWKGPKIKIKSKRPKKESRCKNALFRVQLTEETWFTPYFDQTHFSNCVSYILGEMIARRAQNLGNIYILPLGNVHLLRQQPRVEGVLKNMTVADVENWGGDGEFQTDVSKIY